MSGWTSYYRRKPAGEGDFDYYKITFYLEKKEETRSRVTESIPDSEKTREKIVRVLQKKPSISLLGLAENIGISVKGIEWQISKLKKEGILQRTGHDKGGHWIVLKEME